MITKKFEHGAAFTPTEQAGFALLSIPLDGMRTQSKAYTEQAENIEKTSLPLSVVEKSSSALSESGNPVTGDEAVSNPISNLDKASESEPNFGEKLAGQFGVVDEQGNFNMAGIFDSSCIPCDLRIDGAGLEAFFTEIGTGFENGISEYISFWEGVFRQQLSQLESMANMFNNTDSYIDLCAFIKFFTEFMCIPDIARILSVLMAQMNRMSFEFGGLVDFILQLIGPLFTPMLSNIVALVEQAINMIVKPIECIIDSIQALLAKLDYNVLFQNIDSLDKHVNLGGPKKGAWLPGNEENEAKYRKKDSRGDYAFRLDKPRLTADEPKVPWVDGFIPRRDIVDGERFAEFDFNMAGPLSTYINAENARNQENVEDAASKLAAVRLSATNVDGSDPAAVAKHRAKQRDAEQNYRAAVEKKNLSYVGRANKKIDETVSSVKSSLMTMVGFLREGAQAIQTFFDFVFDELKKLLGEYVGGSGGLIGEIMKRNALSRMISLIKNIYEALQKNALCDENNENTITVDQVIPQDQGLVVWTDDQGNMHISSSQEEIDDAITQVAEAMGAVPGSVASGPNKTAIPKTLPPNTPPSGPANKDRGYSSDMASQKLKSLVQFTGDPVLDSSIARVTEQLTTPVNVVFKCPLNTTVAQTEQINQWIREVNT